MAPSNITSPKVRCGTYQCIRTATWQFQMSQIHAKQPIKPYAMQNYQCVPHSYYDTKPSAWDVQPKADSDNVEALTSIPLIKGNLII